MAQDLGCSTEAMIILSLVPCSSSSSGGCRLVIITSIIVIQATWWDCYSGWINVYMVDTTSIASILLDIRGIYKKENERIITFVFKICDYQLLILIWYAFAIAIALWPLSTLSSKL